MFPIRPEHRPPLSGEDERQQGHFRDRAAPDQDVFFPWLGGS